MAKKDLEHTLNVPRKLRSHPLFYVDMLKSYRYMNHVNVEAFAVRNSAFLAGSNI